MYIAKLANETVVVGSTVRPVSGEELSGPFAGLDRYDPPPDSWWAQSLEKHRPSTPNGSG